MSLAKALKVLIDTMMTHLRSELNCLDERINVKSNLFTKRQGECSKEKFLHKLYVNPYFRDEQYNNMLADLQFRKQLEDPEWQEKVIEETFNDAASEAECRSAWLYAYAPWIKRGDWSEKEVADLLSIAEEHKFRNWIAIAEKLGTGRTAFACVQKYVQELDDKNGKGGCWTPEEDKKLLELVSFFSKGDHVLWRPVAFNLENRDATQCRQRYEALHVRRGHWTEEEDRLLLQAVKRHGKKSWAAVAAQVPDRSAVQCRARYKDVLDKGVKLSSWTKLEDEILMLGFKTFGRCWTKISNLIVGRTGNQVKMRFRALEKIKKKLCSDSYQLQLLAKDRAGKLKRERRAAIHCLESANIFYDYPIIILKVRWKILNALAAVSVHQYSLDAISPGKRFQKPEAATPSITFPPFLCLKWHFIFCYVRAYLLHVFACIHSYCNAQCVLLAFAEYTAVATRVRSTLRGWNKAWNSTKTIYS
ncbi:Myb DNA-bind 6 and Myb DNA-binding domain contain ing protein [Trichuris trichiura]|uniref:Myb DNA-bind 6 and Myb DNA-binding domain contain ing protein n=1 Tax=Trichuris trichiura TaxID=36087 RepID=A0A077ZEZ0_TRITR|nr:Myb DNA-bind 6 and Myb DNA-binding domain contain ing protein [Trichuris trichiura]